MDSSKFHFSSITVDIDAGESAGGCSFTIEAQYDYQGHKWDNDLLETIQVGEEIEIKAGYVEKKKVFYRNRAAGVSQIVPQQAARYCVQDTLNFFAACGTFTATQRRGHGRNRCFLTQRQGECRNRFLLLLTNSL